jgi:hypothetical protein
MGVKPEDLTVSRVFLMDDYHNKPMDKRLRPASVLNDIIRASNEAGQRIDYIAREAAYVPPAEKAFNDMRAREEGLSEYLEDLPEHLRVIRKGAPEKSNKDGKGETGWLETRRPGQDLIIPAMNGGSTLPYSINGTSAYVSVQLYDHSGPKGKISYSCPFLAAMWQRSRLSHYPAHPDFAVPTECFDGPPDFDTWEQMPALMQLNPNAAPFQAKATISILPPSFIPVENAVKTIRDFMDPDRVDKPETDPDRVEKPGYAYPFGLANVTYL